MRIGVPTSFALHAALLGGMVLNLAQPDPFEVTTAEAVPVDIISPEEFSQVTRGMRTAEEVPTPEVPASVGQSETPADTATEGQARQDAATAAETALATPDTVAPPPPPLPELEPLPEPEPIPEPEPTPVAEPEPAPEPEPIAEPEPQPEQQARFVAPQPIARPDVAPQPVQQPQPQPEAPQEQTREFNADEIAALINRDENQGGGGASDASPATLGTATGRDSTLSESEMDAFRRQVSRCWSPPVGAVGAGDLEVLIGLELAEDGSLRGRPRVLNSSGDPFFQASADAAVRAVRRCAPYSLPFEKYAVWQSLELNFNPAEMLR